MAKMGLFTNGFEKAMFRELFDAPFQGYVVSPKTPLSDLILDYCSALAHNPILFPNGVGKKNREHTFYGMYAMGTQLVGMFAPDDESGQATHAAANGFAQTAMNSGAPRSLAVERLGLISKFIESVNRAIDQHGQNDDARGEAVLKAAYLGIFDVSVNEQTILSVTEEINKFYEVFQQFLATHPSPAS